MEELEDDDFQIMNHNQLVIYYMEGEDGKNVFQQSVSIWKGESDEIIDLHITDETTTMDYFNSYADYLKYDKCNLTGEDEKSIHDHIIHTFEPEYIVYERKKKIKGFFNSKIN